VEAVEQYLNFARDWQGKGLACSRAGMQTSGETTRWLCRYTTECMSLTGHISNHCLTCWMLMAAMGSFGWA